MRIYCYNLLHVLQSIDYHTYMIILYMWQHDDDDEEQKSQKLCLTIDICADCVKEKATRDMFEWNILSSFGLSGAV